MLASIFILILFLPVAFLPWALRTFYSSDELNEMGFCLEPSENFYPIQGYELAGPTPKANEYEKTGCVWKTSEQLQTCQQPVHMDSENSPIGGGVFVSCKVSSQKKENKQ